jgi:hypothetical protein
MPPSALGGKLLDFFQGGYQYKGAETAQGPFPKSGNYFNSFAAGPYTGGK